VRRRLWPLLRLVVGVVILGALVARLGTDAVVDGLRAIDPAAVLAALGIGLLTTVVSAWRWCLVARGLGLRLRLPRAVADYYRALFLNSVLPAGVLGDVHRAVSHGRRAGDLGRGVRAVALERLAGLVVLVLVAAAVLLAQPRLLAAAVGDRTPGGVVGAGVLAAAALAGVVALGWWAVRGERASGLRGALRTGLADARAGLFSNRIWPGVVLLSVAAVAGYLALFVVAARTAGSQAALGELLPLLVLALLAMGLPFSIGGFGPREAVSAVAFGAGGLGATQGLAAAVVYGGLSLIACLPGLGVLLLWRAAPAGRVFRGSAGAPGSAPDGQHRTSSVAPC
jgi:uncharacterized membrane protein YbhN (UPF0104 family)